MNELKDYMSLSQLTGLIGDAIAVHLSPSYWIVADIVELRENYSGHCYLSLAEKQDDRVLAQCRASIWKPTFRMLKPYFESTTGQAFSSGISVKIKVAVSFHNVYGLNLTVQDVDPAYTVGELTVRRQQILNLLEKDGVLDMNKALEMPLVPQRIAIISSPTAAGYEDFMTQLKQNPYQYAFHTQLFPAVMQGDGAEQSVVNAMEQIFDQIDDFDVVVIIRGGGSALDLSCFDNYNIAFNLTQFPVPVLVGIGHERDETVLDLVAHTALKTPTAVAAHLIELFQYVDAQIENLTERMQIAVRQMVLRQQQKLYALSASLPNVIGQILAQKRLDLQQKAFRISELTRQYFDDREKELQPFDGRLRIGLAAFFSGQLQFLDKAEMVSLMADPKRLLEKGYSITTKQGKVIKSKDRLGIDDEIQTHFCDGVVNSKIC